MFSKVIGVDGKLPVDIAQDFLANERLPLKWKPHTFDIGFYGVFYYRKVFGFAWKTFVVGIFDDEVSSKTEL